MVTRPYDGAGTGEPDWHSTWALTEHLMDQGFQRPRWTRFRWGKSRSSARHNERPSQDQQNNPAAN